MAAIVAVAFVVQMARFPIHALSTTMFIPVSIAGPVDCYGDTAAHPVQLAIFHCSRRQGGTIPMSSACMT
jgi:hypothetical protein